MAKLQAETDMAVECDVLIIGAGSAGCVAANRLSQSGRLKVILVEAGADFGADENAQIRSLYPLTYADPAYLWPGLQARWHDGSASTPFSQGRLVGGSSSVMGMWAIRGLPQDYDEWQAAGALGWSWADVVPFFRLLESDLDVRTGEDHGTAGPVVIRRQSLRSWPPFSRAIGEAAGDLGIEAREDINGEFGDGLYRLPISATLDGRVSAARAYLPRPVRARPNLIILPNATCLELNVADSRITGARVRYASGERIFLARETILAAGAIHSPALLQVSGIGPAAVLRDAGIAVNSDRRGVGLNLQNHAGVTLGAHLTRQVQSLDLARSAAFSAIRASSGPGYEQDLYLSILDRTSWTYFGGRIGAINAVLHKPYSRGTVSLKRSAAGLEPDVQFRFLSDPRDAPRLIRGIDLAARLLRSPHLRPSTRVTGVLRPSGLVRRLLQRTTTTKLVDGIVGRMARAMPTLENRLVDGVMGLSADELLAALNADDLDVLMNSVTGLFHPVGTCRMGDESDPLAVVSATGRLIGLDGLHILDASIMPTIPRANTNIPTIMVAEKVSAGLCRSIR